MTRKHPPLPSRAMSVALLALGLNLSGVAYAATGGSFILGKANSASAPTSLTASANGPALKVTNTSAKPAASFTVPAGVVPFTVSSAARVANLNADMVDGFNSSDFVRTRDSDTTHYAVTVGRSLTFNLGPTLEMTLACASGDIAGSSKLTETLTNTSTTWSGDWVSSEVMTSSPATAGAVDTRRGSAGTGQSSQIALQNYPATGNLSRPNDFVTMLWLDSSQSVQATYQATAAASQCDVVISWARQPSA